MEAQGILSHATGRTNAGEATILGDSTVNTAGLVNQINDVKAANAKRAADAKKSMADIKFYKAPVAWSEDAKYINGKVNDINKYIYDVYNKYGNIPPDEQIKIKGMEAEVMDLAKQSLDDQTWYNNLMHLQQADKASENRSIMNNELPDEFIGQQLGSRERKMYYYKHPYKTVNFSLYTMGKNSTTTENGGVRTKTESLKDINKARELAVSQNYKNLSEGLKWGHFNGKSAQSGLPTEYETVEDWQKADPEGFNKWVDTHIIRNPNLSQSEIKTGNGNVFDFNIGSGSKNKNNINEYTGTPAKINTVVPVLDANGDVVLDEAGNATTRSSNMYASDTRVVPSAKISISGVGETVNLKTGTKGKKAGIINGTVEQAAKLPKVNRTVNEASFKKAINDLDLNAALKHSIVRSYDEGKDFRLTEDDVNMLKSNCY